MFRKFSLSFLLTFVVVLLIATEPTHGKARGSGTSKKIFPFLGSHYNLLHNLLGYDWFRVEKISYPLPDQLIVPATLQRSPKKSHKKQTESNVRTKQSGAHV